MKYNKYFLYGAIFSVLMLISLPAKAQFEFGPTTSIGTVTHNRFLGPGYEADLGLSARYTFLDDASVSMDVRLDALYSYIFVRRVNKNLFQHEKLTHSTPGFVFSWQDHLLRLPLTIGIRPNEVFNGKVRFRAGVFYGRVLGGKASFSKTPFGKKSNYTFDCTHSQTIPGPDGYHGNMITLSENEHRLGITSAIDVNIWENMDLSLTYMGDIANVWNGMIDTEMDILPQTVRVGVSYWF